MGVWNSVNYSSGYEAFTATNLNVFFAAIGERWDLARSGRYAYDPDDYFTAFGDVPVAVGDYVQLTSGPIFRAMGVLMSIRQSFIDPNYRYGFTGADPTALTSWGASPTATDPIGLFDTYDDNSSEQLRISAGVTALDGADATAFGGKYRAAKSREIQYLTDTIDVDGNTCAAGMRAFFIGSDPSLDRGQLVLCTAPGTWIYDNGGPADILDNVSARPDQCAGGNIIQYDWFWADLRAICNVLGTVVGLPYGGFVVSSLGDPDYSATGDGAYGVTQIAGHTSWAAAKTSAESNYADVGARSHGYMKGSRGLYFPTPSPAWTADIANYSESYGDAVFYTFKTDVEVYTQAAKIDSEWQTGSATTVDTFDAQSLGVTDSEWKLIDTQVDGAAGGTWSVLFGDSAPPSVIPTWAADPSGGGNDTLGCRANFHIGAAGGGGAWDVVVLLKGDVSGGLAYQASTA